MFYILFIVLLAFFNNSGGFLRMHFPVTLNYKLYMGEDNTSFPSRCVASVIFGAFNE